MRRATAATVAACVAAWVLTRWVVYDFHQLGDTRVYEHAARMMDAGALPFRDFDVEYPPLATGIFWIAGIVPADYQLVFSLMMLGCLVATALAALVAARRLELGPWRQAAAVTVVALAPLELGTLLQTRYDLVLAALLGWMLVAALHDRFGWAWLLLAVAVAVKLVPVLLVPVVMIWHARRADRPAARRAAGAAAVGVAATIVPFLVIAPSGTWRLFGYHLERPLQVESLGSSLIHAAGLPFQRVNSFGSENIDGSAAAILAAASTVMLVACLVAIALVTRRLLRRDGPGAGDVLVCGVAATLAAIVVFGKVVSPQYLVWLLPAVLLVRGRRGWAATVAAAVAMGLTQLVFPLLYADLVERGEALPVGLLVLRNALLVAILVLVWPRRAPRRAPGADGGAVAGSDRPAAPTSATMESSTSPRT